MQDRKRVLIVDDHHSVLVTIGDFLKFHGHDIVGTAATALDALQKAESLRPDVVILDLRLNGDEGLEVLSSVLKTNPALRVVILTAFHGGHAVRQAMTLGASAFVAKDRPPEDILAAIASISNGGQFLCPISAAAASQFQDAPLPSERERHAIRLLAQGYSIKESATAMNVTPLTIQTYRKQARKKLGLKTDRDLVSYAYSNALLG